MVLLEAEQQLDARKGSHYGRMLGGYLASLLHTHGISHTRVSDCRALLSLTADPVQLQKHASLGNIVDPLELTHRAGEIKKSNLALQVFGQFPLGT